jgi:hypothetical protein
LTLAQLGMNLFGILRHSPLTSLDKALRAYIPFEGESYRVVTSECHAKYHLYSLELRSLLLVEELKVVGSLSLCLGVVTDVVTASALCWFLGNLRTGYKK